MVELADTQIVYAWREQAEAARRVESRPAMSEEQVIDFVDRYMSAYKQYKKASSTNAATKRRLHFAVVNSRMPISSLNNPFNRLVAIIRLSFCIIVNQFI